LRRLNGKRVDFDGEALTFASSTVVWANRARTAITPTSRCCNSFDQWGVDLSKALCNDLLPWLASGDSRGLDTSTAGVLGRLRA